MVRIMNNIIGKEATGWLLFIIDTCVVLTSFSFVYFLHFGLFESLDHLFQKLPIVLVLSVLSFGLIVNYKRTGHFFTDQLFFRVQVASLVQAILIYGITLIEKYLGVFEFNISLGFVVFYLVFNSVSGSI